MSIKKRMLGTLIEKARRGEKDTKEDIEKARRGEDTDIEKARRVAKIIGLRYETGDADGFAALESIIEAWDRGKRGNRVPLPAKFWPSDDEIEILIEAARYVVLPRTGGRSRKTCEAEERKALLKAEARAYQQKHKKDFDTAADAWQATVTKMRETHEEELKGKSVKTLIDLWSRR